MWGVNGCRFRRVLTTDCVSFRARRDDQDPRRTKIHPVRDLAVYRRICDGCPLVLHVKNIARLDWFKIKFNTEKQLGAWKKRMRQVKEAWNEETYFQYLNQKSQLRCTSNRTLYSTSFCPFADLRLFVFRFSGPYEPLTRSNRQVSNSCTLFSRPYVLLTVRRVLGSQR